MQRCEFVFCPPFRLLSSSVPPLSLHPRFPLTFTFPTSPSFLVSMRSSRAPLLFGSSMAWSGCYHLCPPGMSWMVYGLQCCPCRKHYSEKGPQRGQRPDNMRLLSVCTAHLLFALPDQEARNRHCWSHSSLSRSVRLFCYSKHSLVGLTMCLELVTVIWWLMQQISKYSHNAVVFQELLAMETQGHLRGDEWEG